MAIAVIKLEILSAAPNSEVKIDLCETSREFRQAAFVLYNCARLSKLFQNFEENVHKGIYPALPPVNDVDFNLLHDQICCFLFNLSHKFSAYYGRVHILGESKQHLFPTMFARLYLMKTLQQVSSFQCQAVKFVIPTDCLI
ncbi:DALR anticodon-binding domain-containing protein 3-like isoform X3 [Orbicella faveolata]|nr:DALR anticodon-binding domain-containing protein 3-like isoform X3 [Orbicella faveolata]